MILSQPKCRIISVKISLKTVLFAIDKPELAGIPAVLYIVFFPLNRDIRSMIVPYVINHLFSQTPVRSASIVIPLNLKMQKIPTIVHFLPSVIRATHSLKVGCLHRLQIMIVNFLSTQVNTKGNGVNV